MIKKFVLICFSVFLSMASFGSSLNAILEGPESELYYGDISNLTLTIWPVSEKEAYIASLDDNLFAGSITILGIKGAEFSHNNEEALVLTFVAAILGNELPENIILRGTEIPLMKRNLSISEFHPESEQLFLFLELIPESFKHAGILIFLTLCLALIVALFVQKLLMSRRLKVYLRARHSDVLDKIQSLELMNKVDFLYRNEDLWLKYYDSQKWRAIKSKLNESVYKKEHSSEELAFIKREVEAILSEVEKWST